MNVKETYQLWSKGGKINCPACERYKCFSLYRHIESGDMIDKEFGRCDHRRCEANTSRLINGNNHPQLETDDKEKKEFKPLPPPKPPDYIPLQLARKIYSSFPVTKSYFYNHLLNFGTAEGVKRVLSDYYVSGYT